MAEPVVIDPTDFDAVGVLTEAIVSLRAHVLISEVDASATVSAPEGWHPLVINAKQGGSSILIVRFNELSSSRLRNVADALVLGVGPQWVSPHGPAPDATDPDAQPTLTETVEQFERSLIADALQRHAGNVGQTAKALSVPKTTLVDKIRKHGLR